MADENRAAAVRATEDGEREERAENVSKGRSRRRADYAPEGTDTRTGLFPTLKRTFKEFSEDGMTDWAASLTYYGLMSLFPMLIVLVALIGIFGDPQTTTKKITDIVSSIGPKSAVQTFSGPIKSVTQNKGASGVIGLVGLVFALSSASGYIGAFGRAQNIAYETPEGRPFWKLKPLQMLVTLVLVILLAIVALSLVLTGPIVRQVAGPLGIGSAAIDVWNIAKWPVLVFLVLLIFAILYYSTPNVRLPKFSLVTPGAIFALVVWIIASVAFAFYVANFGSYNKTYGALAGVVIFLLWTWITNCALLLGAELNSEKERSRELEAGVKGAEKEIQLDARDDPKAKATT